MNKIKILTKEQIKERYKKCVEKKLCFISLQPLDLINEGTCDFEFEGIYPIIHKKYIEKYYKIKNG